LSIDICFWESGADPANELYDAACEGDHDPFVSSGHVLEFRDEIVARWPEIEDCLEPFHFNPDLDEQEDLSRYILITLPYSKTDLISSLRELALSYGLEGFDPTIGQAITAR
jgi:hypothetical protein